MCNKQETRPKGRSWICLEVKKGFAQKVALQPDLVVLMNHRELVIPGSRKAYTEAWRQRSVLLERTNNLNA